MACSIAETQFLNTHGDSYFIVTLIGQLNLFFTIAFTAELVINALANWFVAFLSFWSLLDVFIVALSLFSVVATNQSAGTVRILRAFRILRLFGKVRSLRKIVSALTKSIVPVSNVFLIMFLLISFGRHPAFQPPPFNRGK